MSTDWYDSNTPAYVHTQQVPGLSLHVQDGQLDRWYGTSDIKANACDIISEVIVPVPVTEEEVRASGSADDDMDTSTLEEMFQLQPSAISGTLGFLYLSILNLKLTVSKLCSLACQHLWNES